MDSVVQIHRAISCRLPHGTETWNRSLEAYIQYPTMIQIASLYYKKEVTVSTV